MLFGIPFSKMPDDERDRVDMAVERMTVPDVEFLSMVWERRRIAGAPYDRAISHVFGPSGVAVIIDGANLRIATPKQRHAGEFSESLFKDPKFVGDRTALASLVSIGCLDIGPVVLKFGKRGETHHLIILPLGEMVLRALEEVRPGLDAQV